MGYYRRVKQKAIATKPGNVDNYSTVSSSVAFITPLYRNGNRLTITTATVGGDGGSGSPSRPSPVMRNTSPSTIPAGSLQRSSSHLCLVCYNHPCVCECEIGGIGKSEEGQSVEIVCDACPGCDDECENLGCRICRKEQNRSSEVPVEKGRDKEGQFTICQIIRHNKEYDIWLVAYGYVYNVTHMGRFHPGGAAVLLRGTGRDCTLDYDFHSKDARKQWDGCRIGRVVECPRRVAIGIKDDLPKVSSCAVM